MGVTAAFNVALHVPVLKETDIATVLTSLQTFDPEEVPLCSRLLLSESAPGKPIVEMIPCIGEGHYQARGLHCAR